MKASSSSTVRCSPLTGFSCSSTRPRGEYTVIHNDNEAIKQFMEQEPLLAGFNNKHYDQFILKAVLADYTPEEVKVVNDLSSSRGMRDGNILISVRAGSTLTNMTSWTIARWGCP